MYIYAHTYTYANAYVCAYICTGMWKQFVNNNIMDNFGNIFRDNNLVFVNNWAPFGTARLSF